MTTVSGKTLAELNVPVPGYDRRQVTTGIVHIGVGGFHEKDDVLIHWYFCSRSNTHRRQQRRQSKKRGLLACRYILISAIQVTCIDP